MFKVTLASTFGVMHNLPRLLDGARAAGAEFMQAFTPACVPIRTGVASIALDDHI